MSGALGFDTNVLGAGNRYTALINSLHFDISSGRFKNSPRGFHAPSRFFTNIHTFRFYFYCTYYCRPSRPAPPLTSLLYFTSLHFASRTLLLRRQIRLYETMMVDVVFISILFYSFLSKRTFDNDDDEEDYHRMNEHISGPCSGFTCQVMEGEVGVGRLSK